MTKQQAQRFDRVAKTIYHLITIGIIVVVAAIIINNARRDDDRKIKADQCEVDHRAIYVVGYQSEGCIPLYATGR